jgi:hypothetical protein
MELTDAERRALEWLRDGDQRFGGVDRRVRNALMRRRLLMPVISRFSGQPGAARYIITDPGLEALGASGSTSGT